MRQFLERYYGFPLSQIFQRVIWREGIKEFLRHLLFCLFFPISFPLRLLNFRVIDSVDHGCSIGGLCVRLDAYLKEKRLQRIPNYKIIFFPLISPPFRFNPFRMNFINRYFCELWRPYFFVVTNPFLTALFKYAFLSPWLQLSRPYYSKLPNQSFYAVNRAYYARFPKGEPILKIPQIDRVKGWEILKTFGLNPKDWFVTFYAREPGHYDDQDQKSQGVIRNVDVLTYEKAILEVLNRGGWCIRMGSSKMNPLPESLRCLSRVIDYPRTAAVSDFMDVFLAANCKFMLTCASGLSYMPALFGNPIVATNLITWNEVKGLHPRDISLPKKFYSKKFKRMLTFSETLGSYLIDHWMFYFFDAFGLQLIPNTQEEIYEATKEMLDRLENVYQEPSDAQILQRKFHKAIPDCLLCKDALGKIGDHFLKTNQHLLDVFEGIHSKDGISRNDLSNTIF